MSDKSKTIYMAPEKEDLSDEETRIEMYHVPDKGELRLMYRKRRYDLGWTQRFVSLTRPEGDGWKRVRKQLSLWVRYHPPAIWYRDLGWVDDVRAMGIDPWELLEITPQ
jgi:hypothetical protein